MRRALDFLYDAAGYAAAFFMAATLAAVLVGVASRELGVFVRGTDSYAGYFTAAAGFLALAHTFARGEHIRVTLILQSVGPRLRNALEIASLAIAAALAAALAWFSVRLAWQSFAFNDISTGNDATPLWIPQLSMALGTLVFAIAVADALVRAVARGRIAAPAAAEEPLHVE